MSLFRREDTRLRKERTGANPFAVGLLVLVLIAIGTFFGFTKHIPFTHGYQLKGVFAQANSIRKNSPVRIAGVNVGKVKAI
jgi:phospholipid/cholesterol/gamma-HCH transport system substrate-binding protein